MKNFDTKKIDFKYWVSLGIGILSIGLGYYTQDNPDISKLLIIAGTIISLAPILVYVSFNYLLLPVLSFIGQFNLNLNLDSRSTLNIANDIYDYARENGGFLDTTHIFQQRVTIDKDIAIKNLSKKIKKNLKFRRTLLFTNKKEERDWVEKFFKLQTYELEPILHFWKRIDIKVSKGFIGLLPRFNLMLYKSPDNKKFKVLIGFERVRSRSTYFKKNLNISLYSESEIIYNGFQQYYESIVLHPEIGKATSLDSYDEQQDSYALTHDEQFIIKKVLDYSYTNTHILHVGAFGGTALYLNNISFIRRNVNHFSDIDLLVVTENKISDVKDDLNKLFSDMNVDIVYGDDDEYFYHMRGAKNSVVDIEIFNKDSTYYSINKLLGYSIFHHYVNLFSSEDKPLDQLLSLPNKPLSQKERIELVLNDKKGVREFIERISNSNRGL